MCVREKEYYANNVLFTSFPSLSPPTLLCFFLAHTLRERFECQGTLLGVRDTTVNTSGKIPPFMFYNLVHYTEYLAWHFQNSVSRRRSTRCHGNRSAGTKHAGEFEEELMGELMSRLRRMNEKQQLAKRRRTGVFKQRDKQRHRQQKTGHIRRT